MMTGGVGAGQECECCTLQTLKAVGLCRISGTDPWGVEVETKLQQSYTEFYYMYIPKAPIKFCLIGSTTSHFNLQPKFEKCTEMSLTCLCLILKQWAILCKCKYVKFVL